MDTSTTVSATASGFFRNGLYTNPAQWSGRERAQELFQFVKDLHKIGPYLWYCSRHEYLLETINGLCALRYSSNEGRHTFVSIRRSQYKRLASIKFAAELPSTGITYGEGLDRESRLFPCMPLVWQDLSDGPSRRGYSVEEQFLLLTTKFEWVLFSRVMQATPWGDSSSVYSCTKAEMKLISDNEAQRRIEESSLQVWYIGMISLEWVVHRTIDVKEAHLHALAERAQLFHDRLARLHIELPLKTFKRPRQLRLGRPYLYWE